MSATVNTLSSISVNSLVTDMNTNNSKQSEYTLVVGLGSTGLSVVRYLIKQKKEIIVADSRKQPAGLKQFQLEFPNVKLELGEFNKALFLKAKQIIVSPGVSLAVPEIDGAVKQGVDVVGDVELFAQQVTKPIIAVTGSNGKSTVVSLLGEMAKAANINAVVGGNIGVPVLNLINSGADLFILELSSFQLESLQSLKPVSAAVLNLSPDHMDRYDSYEDYTAVKNKIYKHCEVAVINLDDSIVCEMKVDQKNIVGFTLNEPAENEFGICIFEDEKWLCKNKKRLLKTKSLKISGLHNVSNALAALALGEAAGIPLDDMLSALKAFTGLAHRTQWVAEIEHVNWINDSKGTNVGATIAAINGLDVENKIILIAGGIAKDADFSSLNIALKQKVRSVVLMGQDAEIIEKAIQIDIPIYHALNLHDAVSIAVNISEEKDTVLFSPACASFDMFNSFEHRGECFISEVEALK